MAESLLVGLGHRGRSATVGPWFVALTLTSLSFPVRVPLHWWFVPLMSDRVRRTKGACCWDPPKRHP